MNREIIDVKIESLRRCLDRIKSKQPFTVEQLTQSFDLQDIISVNLERAVQNAVDIASIVVSELNLPPPQTMSEAFGRLNEKKILTQSTMERMMKSVGFRNLLIHEYAAIEWEIVHKIATTHLDDFKAFIREVDLYFK